MKVISARVSAGAKTIKYQNVGNNNRASAGWFRSLSGKLLKAQRYAVISKREGKVAFYFIF